MEANTKEEVMSLKAYPLLRALGMFRTFETCQATLLLDRLQEKIEIIDPAHYRLSLGFP